MISKGLDHSTCGQVFDFQSATGHFVHAGDVLLRHFAENFVGAPGALHLEHDGRLSDSNHGCTHQRRSHSRSSGFAKETATAGLRGIGRCRRNVLSVLGHGCLLLNIQARKNYRLVLNYVCSNTSGRKWKPGSELSFFSSRITNFFNQDTKSKPCISTLRNPAVNSARRA